MDARLTTILHVVGNSRKLMRTPLIILSFYIKKHIIGVKKV